MLKKESALRNTSLRNNNFFREKTGILASQIVFNITAFIMHYNIHIFLSNSIIKSK